MNKFISLYFLISILVVSSSIAQTAKTGLIKFPQKELNEVTNHQLQNINNPPINFTKVLNFGKVEELPEHSIYQAIKKLGMIKSMANHSPDFNHRKLNKSKSDTLFVFKDTTISGTWTHNGPIVIASNTTLYFTKVHATIIGDLILWGDSARLIVDSSYLYSPQEYFYQRSLIAVLKSHVIIKNSTLDYSNLPHNLSTMNSAKVEMFNVTNIGFTTNGVSNTSSININGSNQAGEYVITDSVKLNFQNATTVLLWHQFADTALINFEFPDGTNLASYQFNNTLPGVKGIEYNVNVSNCKDVMWALMPANGSNVTISNSDIRSIGLLFFGKDSITVSGLIDNSTYSDFKAPVSDRNLHLINSSVSTWSLYTMNKSKLYISGSIVGEVGSENSSQITGMNFVVDGSGGYFWTNDTSFIVAENVDATTYVRSQGHGIFFYAYSAITNGIASAIGNSLLLVAQSSLPQDPTALEGSCVWFCMINKPSLGYASTVIPVIGSAWIDKGPTSILMNFNYYKLYYKIQSDTAWTQIGSTYSSKVRNDTLAYWNTKGLAAGQYNLKLSVTDDTPQKNTMDAIISVNLLPAILSIDEQRTTNNVQLLTIYPNPVNDLSVISYHLSEKTNVNLKLFDLTGREIKTLVNDEQYKGDYKLSFDSSDINSGIYCVRITTNNFTQTKKIILK